MFNGSTEDIIERYQSGTKISIHEAPTREGYKFLGWSIDGKNAIASENLANEIVAALQNGDVNLTPIYTKLDSFYTVTVINGTGGGSFASTSAAAVTANEPADGMKFAYWVDSSGQILSYEKTYVFVVTGDTVLEAVYVEADDEVETQVLLAITDKSSNPEAGTVRFVVVRDVPTKFTVVQTGILLTNNAELGTDGDAFIIDAPGTIKGTNATTENKGTYVATKTKVQADDTWYARGYVVYLDTNGELVYLYSAIDSITA